MSSNPLRPADYELAQYLFRTAIESNLGEEENYDDVRRDFGKAVTDAIGSGEFIVETKRLVVDHLWERMNGRAGNSMKRLLRDVSTGQTSMDLDEWLDSPVTVGKHRRTTVRHYNLIDNQRQIEERRANVKKQELALAEAESATGVLAGALTRYGSIPTWLHEEPESVAFFADEPEEAHEDAA